MYVGNYLKSQRNKGKCRSRTRESKKLKKQGRISRSLVGICFIRNQRNEQNLKSHQWKSIKKKKAKRNMGKCRSRTRESNSP